MITWFHSGKCGQMELNIDVKENGTMVVNVMLDCCKKEC